MQTLANALTLLWVYVLIVGYFLLEENTFRYLIVAVIVVIIITWILHIIYFCIGPLILKKSKFCFAWRRVKSRSVKFDEEQSIENYNQDIREVVFEYRLFMNAITCSPTHTFIYRGDWKDRRPHGWGEWRDDSFYGESLVGYWQCVFPVLLFLLIINY